VSSFKKIPLAGQSGKRLSNGLRFAYGRTDACSSVTKEPDMELRRNDRVIIKNLGIEGQVIEVDTRSIVVRYKKDDGELIEHRFQSDDLEYLPKPQLE
jgi:hypothetical protein